MKNLILATICCILSCLGSSVSGQKQEIMDSIPSSWYGCYHEKGKMDFPVLTIQHNTVEYQGNTFYSREIHKYQDGFRIKAISRSDSLLLDLAMVETHHLHVSGYPVGDTDLWETWKLSQAKSIAFTDLPSVLKRKWYQKVSEDGFWPFFIVEKGISAQSLTPYLPDEILALDYQYRILVNTGQSPCYFFLKNPDRHHIDLANGTGEFKTYTSHMDVPATRPDNLDLIPGRFWTQWFATDLTEKLWVTTGKEDWAIDGKTYELAHFKQSHDTLYFKLLYNNNVFPVAITQLGQQYMQWQWIEDAPVILKSSPEVPNGYEMKYEDFPGWFFGYWYATDGTNQMALSLESKALQVNGKTIKKFLLYENMGAYHLEYGSVKDPTHLTIEPLNYEYLLVNLTGHAPMLLKHGRNLPNLISLSKAEIPDAFIGNWFDPDKQNQYEYTLSRDCFIYQGEFFDYSDIMRGAGRLEFTIKNENHNYPVVIDLANGASCYSIGGGTPKVTKSIRSQAVPGHNGSTEYPEFNYIKGSKFVLNGYILHHEQHPDFDAILFYWHPTIGDNQKQKSVMIGNDGKFRLEIDLDHAVELHGHFGKGFINLFAAPGHENTLVLNAREYTERSAPALSIAFSGPWASEMYLQTDYFKDYLSRQQNDSDMNHIRDDDSTAYKAYLSEIYHRQVSELDSFCSTLSYSPFFRKWAETRVNFSYYNDLMRYRWLKNSYNLIQSPYDIPVSKQWLEWDSYLPIDDQLIFNTEVAMIFHEHRMWTYKQAMMDFYPKFPYLSLPKDENGKEVSKTGYYMTFLKLAGKNYSPFMRDILMASFVESVFSRESLEVMDPVMTDFLEKSVTPIAEDFLNDSYQLFKKHGKAEIPDHTMIETQDTSKMDTWEKLIYPHRGKVIYVDFWATWCGPCVSKFPYSKMLHDALDSKDVVFMYLCGGGSKKPAWSAMIEQYGLQGDHHLLNDKQWREVCNKFDISGIPHYVLVDPSGKVVDKEADSPQGSKGYNKELYQKILALIKKE